MRRLNPILGVGTAFLAASIATSCGNPPAANNGAPSENPSENPVLECIMTRSSVRNFTNQTISKDTLDLILKAAMAAPTAVDRRPWKFVVLQGQPLTVFKDSMNYGPGRGEATAAIVVCGDREKFAKGGDEGFWIQDTSAATENALLAIHALGLGGLWTGVYPIQERVDKVSRLLDLPSTLIPLDVILLGYPASEPNIKDKYDTNNIIWKNS